MLRNTGKDSVDSCAVFGGYTSFVHHVLVFAVGTNKVDANKFDVAVETVWIVDEGYQIFLAVNNCNVAIRQWKVGAVALGQYDNA